MTAVALAAIVVAYFAVVLVVLALCRAARRADIDAAMRRHPAGRGRPTP